MQHQLVTTPARPGRAQIEPAALELLARHSAGLRAFLARVVGIESGAECQRLAPLISKVADGEASAEEMRSVRPHLKGCLPCKATLREYRATPSRVAGLVPPVVALAGGGSQGW